MFSNYVKVAAATPRIRVADCEYNAGNILESIKKASDEGVHLLCFPELCITGYTCGDLFLQNTLLNSAREMLSYLIEKSSEYDIIVVVGLPMRHEDNLYNAAAVFGKGELFAIIAKSNIPNYGEFSESRYFNPAPHENASILFDNEFYEFGKVILRMESHTKMEFSLKITIGDDLRSCIESESESDAMIRVNLSASSEIVGKAEYRRLFARERSRNFICGYVYVSSGYGESTTGLVFSGHNIICENGVILTESKPFDKGYAVSEIDLYALSYERTRLSAIMTRNRYNLEKSIKINPAGDLTHFTCDTLTRHIDPMPFVPQDKSERYARCEEIMNIQAYALAKRVEHLGIKSMVLGISGGLDSCLALLIIVKACEIIGMPFKNVLAVSMPCFGTSARTKGNARELCNFLDVSFREIDITKSVELHLKDIGHTQIQDATFENAQARMRTMVLMDLANATDGIVVGTGDLSEIALGWSTYNGDHMSMYSVNAGVPKTLVRHIVGYATDVLYAPGGSGTFKDRHSNRLSVILMDILDTPISPELLPAKDGEIVQYTEELVGPYVLHDFFLYHVMRWGREPKEVFGLAKLAFCGTYSAEVILQWLKVFYRRFFAHQFKRNSAPDAPKIGTVNLASHMDWRMPSDAVSTLWLEQLSRV
ncbi:MAG: NAD(+) synthase [Turicibacter sp.]|nr:NAD(+) synthase [Turicibacter sp.]